MFYANLIKDFIDEILEGGDRNQGNFDDGARVQEVINAVERSFHASDDGSICRSTGSR